MSTTQRVKKIILQLLNDEEIHGVKEIKAFIASQTDDVITEGVTAGCLKTMTTGKIIEIVERGKYRLLKREGINTEEIVEETVEENDCEKKVNDKMHEEIVLLTKKYMEDALKIINNIDITEENKELIFSIMDLRKKIDTFFEEIKEFHL
mgnify:CR=1 FL=1